MTNQPIISTDDRARGFAEIELVLTDGSRQAFRVHALEQAALLHVTATHTGDAALVPLLAKALRESPDFIGEKLTPFARLAVAETLLALSVGVDEAASILKTAVALGQRAVTSLPAPAGVTSVGLGPLAPVEVTAADIRAGQKEVSARTRRGETVPVTVHSLTWRAAMRAGAQITHGDSAQAVITVLEASLAQVKDREALLDSLVPHDLPRLAGVALKLTEGPSGKDFHG